MNDIEQTEDCRLQDIETNHNLKRVEQLGWLMDEAVPLPGGFRIGLDGIVGLIPGIGDVGSFLVSIYIINEARRLGVPRFTLFRMIFNVTIDTLIGAIPLIGDLFDFYYKSNTRNLALLKKHLEINR